MIKQVITIAEKTELFVCIKYWGSQLIQQILTDIKGEADLHKGRVDSIIYHLPLERSFILKVYKEMSVYTICQINDDRILIYFLHTFLWAGHETFSDINHILANNEKVYKWKKLQQKLNKTRNQ